ncbi:RDD family protein [Massilia sp. DWR3-1-1]|uniref:RDD family protein n=1 Tax=Massilia sp. DWR3-1-1 TaxID=2804559 RepID=UPI003CE7840B
MDELDLEYVGFWPRVWASLIDTVIIFVVTTPLLLMVYGKNYYSLSGFSQGPVDFIISYLIPAAIVIVFWTTRNATPGKMAIGAKIVDASTGDAPSLGQYIGRYFGYFVSIFPLFLGIFWVGFDRKKRGWHDMLSGTVVVRCKNRGPEPVRLNNLSPSLPLSF